MTTTKTLFEKLGGKPAVTAVVDNFYQRILADPTVSHFFAGTDMVKQRAHQAAFLGMALGGPNEYRGRAMRAAHTGLGITDEHFGAIAGHLQAALEWAGVGADDIRTIIGVAASLKNDVVGV
ncbi:MAG TPA: group 1 truncated hemoglobin [bacterium]|nr:group 1 truncated hemoglobin [bacterium]